MIAVWSKLSTAEILKRECDGETVTVRASLIQRAKKDAERDQSGTGSSWRRAQSSMDAGGDGVSTR